MGDPLACDNCGGAESVCNCECGYQYCSCECHRVGLDRYDSPRGPHDRHLTKPSWPLDQRFAIIEHELTTPRDPVSLLESRIATASLQELDDLNEKLDALGTRMVERAAELRRVLRGG